MRPRTNEDAVLAVAFALRGTLVRDRGDANAGAIDVVSELSTLAIPTAILTDATNAAAARDAALVGFTGSLLTAEAIGFTKPDSKAFAAVTATLGLSSAGIYYVSAEPRDVAAAGSFGFITVWLDLGADAFPDDSAAPTHTIESLTELLPIIAGPYTRGLLGLRYVAHSVLAWRPGHFVPGAEYGRRK